MSKVTDIYSMPYSDQGRENHDRIFGKKKPKEATNGRQSGTKAKEGTGKAKASGKGKAKAQGAS